MSIHHLAQLHCRHDLRGLDAALRTLCSGYGKVTQLIILPANHVGKRQALCFLRMASAAQEQHIMTALGIGRFGGELVLVVDLQPAAGVDDRPAPVRSAPAQALA
ncbi:MAG: hypothetical protein B7X59_08175 [Polaromonas sp. 39-63-203]|jgi:hypothetical protein|uniref:hypothetical protein n=1 Tax=Polaromonas sp. TaxID=1869339 RepID=UPI000BD78394|nr:hypothetical protein [Polaromonas sp.]OYY51999.1 MAG: hypothetical protein B7Y54_08500 [Polaromonas sp. 35-63-240]OYY95135.1 MAG: hypothetical protein B7Y42_10935 [Polaromonas sp. 28-63-22]OYZ83539.1 MAG: hypothetical protein B7Y03_08640 [Polaromonas sp. 24-62-144]OZA97290.1 MAG: hypothetical protein B7X59_08175 [Polaromonas sp. 39-63-203]HQS32560.1 hypothetical protein [Polaromonas sp.]